MSRLFAVIPAAGRSVRMGRPKLLLPWRGKSVISHLLHALVHPRIMERVVVTRPDDIDLHAELQSLPADVVIPDEAPPDMKASVKYALERITRQLAPQPEDGWLLIPADSPLMTAAMLAELIEAYDKSPADVLLPTYEGKGGHPVFFRWRVAESVKDIPPDQGVNWLVKSGRFSVERVPVENPDVLKDLDTPEDWWKLTGGDLGEAESDS